MKQHCYSLGPKLANFGFVLLLIACIVAAISYVCHELGLTQVTSLRGRTCACSMAEFQTTVYCRFSLTLTQRPETHENTLSGV